MQGTATRPLHHQQLRRNCHAAGDMATFALIFTHDLQRLSRVEGLHVAGAKGNSLSAVAGIASAPPGSSPCASPRPQPLPLQHIWRYCHRMLSGGKPCHGHDCNPLRSAPGWEKDTTCCREESHECCSSHLLHRSLWSWILPVSRALTSAALHPCMHAGAFQAEDLADMNCRSGIER